MKRSLKLLKQTSSPVSKGPPGKTPRSVKKQAKETTRRVHAKAGGREKARETTPHAAVADESDRVLTGKTEQESKTQRKGKRAGDLAEDVAGNQVPARGTGKANANLKREREKNEKRFILFAGNLPLGTKAEDLKAFFKNKLQRDGLFDVLSTEPRIVEVRMLTHRETNKPKGCAFVEFDCREALEIALNYHHRELGGRRINIELSAGG
ncbi:putative RNA-binding protein [Neospora caninum Liverpool]|nr:putative RNA-binding protein [Neospora caninum Liverpool]CBZ54435.1 putative RNA-binding protein [Neospora caninum Liverpool]|eukprot:XP_003884465.1 putative RNA-binding protein [Neospora caninum Liverpool]